MSKNKETPSPHTQSRAVKITKVITLCGSTRFPQAFELANMHLSLQGHVVISLGCFGHADLPVGAKFLTSDGDEKTPEKQALDQLHFRKIDLCDEIFVVNVGGYVGSSTKREIAYAQSNGKAVRYMFDTPEKRQDREGLINAINLAHFPPIPIICDCERSQNGLGLSGRECDCEL